ncbi:MAG: hypothetical protein J6I98_02300 [Clostridia bacterium]|nr:hypothetical protein [Clostridia bacterium]
MGSLVHVKITPWSLLKFALPTMAANLFMSVYMTVDGIFVANCVNTDALSAVNIVMPYVMIVLALGTMFGTGGSAVLSAAMYLLGIVLKDPLISIFAEAESDVYKMAADGYRIFSVSYLYMGFSMYASSLFTALGDGRTSAVISFCRGLVFLSATLYGLSALFGLNGLWAAMPAAEFAGLVLSVICIHKMKGKYGYA